MKAGATPRLFLCPTPSCLPTIPVQLVLVVVPSTHGIIPSTNRYGPSGSQVLNA